MRRPPRSLRSTVSTPQYRVLRLRSRTLPSVRKVRKAAKAQVMANVCRAFLAIGVLFAEPQVVGVLPPALVLTTYGTMEYSRPPCAHHLWYNGATCRSLPPARPTAPASMHAGAHAAPMQCLLGCGPRVDRVRSAVRRVVPCFARFLV